MGLESGLQFALVALEMNLASREQVLGAVGGWLDARDAAALGGGVETEGLEARLCRDAGLDEACVQAIRETVARGGPQGVDDTVRAEVLDMMPPPEIRAWLSALGSRRIRGPAFQAAPREERYRLGAAIASGGLGRVFEAEDRDLRRLVALKLLRDGYSAADEERFVREARLAARLEHPVIVPTYDFGTMGGGGKLFLCMKRIRGRDLLQLLDAIAAGEPAARAAWSRGRLLGVVQDVCLGIAFAHSKGVIHRDLKPSNVMVGEFGETMIVDWGLAKAAGEPDVASPAQRSPASAAAGTDTTQITLAGSVLGTPAYMPPEQAAGRLEDLDARSDVYALGGILYAVLTWQAPVQASTAEEAIQLAREGRLETPSARVRRTAAEGRPAPDPVPPELDAICMKALAFRREDRFPTALDMHHELQLFLEGVRDRERRAREARERVQAGRGLLEKYRAFQGEIRAQAAAVARLTVEVPRHAAAELKRPLWDAVAAQRRMEEERIAAYAKSAAEFGQALAVDAECAEAADGLCDLYLERLAEAERRRDRAEELLLRNQILNLGGGGRHRARLERPGRLRLRATAYRCGCLAPVKDPAWKFEIAETPTVVWRDGRPRPGVEPGPADRMAPEHRAHPAPWGHGPACEREEVECAEVRIARYETRDQRLVPGPETVLGRTPLEGPELAPGSYVCTLSAPGFAPVRVPVLIRRDETWEQDVVLYRPAEIPKCFVQIPGGPFTWGGSYAAGNEEEEMSTRDIFIGKFSITAGEYLAFLNDLFQTGRADEARRRAPRDAADRFLRETPAGFELSAPGDPAALTQPDFPAVGVSWHDSCAFAAWRSAREGIAYSLPAEDEWEKAARGVDRRIYPFGEEFDWSFAQVAGSLAEGPHLLPIGAFSLDESPYGVRDTAGCVSNWMLNATEIPYRHYRALRGGAWFIGPANARIVYRRAFLPETTTRYYGFRLCVRPVRD